MFGRGMSTEFYGILEPKEPLALEEGEELTITITPSSPLSETSLGLGLV